MPKLTIDGKEIEVDPGTPVIEAAKRLGKTIPHYCYHPGLEPAGSCRMCFVEIEKAPKLQISCYTPAAEGMVVRTETEAVKQARRSMLELLLINHPLDCPVCDQAGECQLQNYYMDHGLHPGVMADAKVQKSKKAFPIGDTIILDQERCILCSRCVRFTHEVSKTGDLGIYFRGNRAFVDVAPGQQLSGNYTGNLADICPVGALLDRDFRFKCRVWYLGSANSICPGCSRGCNIQIHYNASGRTHKGGGDRVMRLKPRYNRDVNKWWICDVGRYGYKEIDSPHRLRPPTVEGDGADPEAMDATLDAAAEQLRKLRETSGPDALAVLASPRMSNEALFLVRRLFRDGLGLDRVDWRVPPAEAAEGDGFLLQADRNPNSRGATLILGGEDRGPDEVLKGRKGAVIFGHDLAARKDWAQHLEGLDFTIYVGPLANKTSRAATIVLASAVYAEEEGTFTNFEGRVQRFHAAVEPLQGVLPEREILQALGKRLDVDMPQGGAEEVFRSLAATVNGFVGMTYEGLGSGGKTIKVG